MKIEKIAFMEGPSMNGIMEAFRVTGPKGLELSLKDSVGQKPTKTKWFHIGTIIYGGDSATTLLLKGLCDVEYGTESYSRFEARYDTEFKSGIIKFTA